uniref:Uncharacterized protein n=1 Tax=Oryza barthii TaxID=65489 RepID=A0A0D3F3L1_9ORYZ
MAGHVACGLTRQRATWRWQAALRWTDLIEKISSLRRRHQQLGGGGGGVNSVGDGFVPTAGMYDESKCLASTNKKPERIWSDTINQESGRLESRGGGSGECKEEADEEAVDDAYAEIIESHARTRLVSVEDDGGRRRRYDACRL